MTSERDNCGLSSILPISCRDRAEAFARRLQSRLSSLGSHNSSSDERSWLGPHESPIALSQPLHTAETDIYLGLDTLESPCSPQDEIEETELHRLLNKDNLTGTNGDCHCPKINVEGTKYAQTNGLTRHHSADSDSEIFYDLDDELPTQPYANGIKSSQSIRSIESETGIYLNSQGTSSSNPSETFATSLDCTPQPSESDELSTLSFRDEDGSFVEETDIIERNCEECEACEVNKEEEEAGIDETDFKICNGKINNELYEEYGNDEVPKGTEESEIYISNLSVRSKLVVECNIGNEESIIVESKETEKDVAEDVGDYESEDNFIPRVRRCSSLKTGKTPPGTPGRKKIVRFADVLGLDLADVRTFLDEVPKVPKSAYDDLRDADISESSSDMNSINGVNKYHGIKTDRILVPLFDQPAGLPNFLDLVRDNQVCLENALVDDPILFLIKGTVRVRNLDFHKSVHIRYSLDCWKTYADVKGTYVDNSCDGFSDKFSFIIYAHTLTIGQRLEFACRFQSKGCQYWDNNKGHNYCFQCLPSASNTTSPITNHVHDDWGASFY